jgi:hypothetical protein
MSVAPHTRRSIQVAALVLMLGIVGDRPARPCYEHGSSGLPETEILDEPDLMPIVPSVRAAAATYQANHPRVMGSSLPPNPFVAGLLGSVSSDSISATITKLVGFYTRHTNSDTLSPTRGIGACRNWIRSRFADYATAPGSDMSASFFTFDTTACSILRRHKNVLAQKVGAISPERTFIVSGHMDSRMEQNCSDTAFAPGANDDGSGVALVLEMARILSPHTLDASLTMMTVTGEEQGLLGAAAYAKFAVSSGMRIDGMATNDIVGNITGCEDPACPPGEPVITDSMSVRTFSRNPSTSNGRQMTRAVRLIGERYMPEFLVKLIPLQDRPGRSGDHIPFGNRGYTAMRFTEPYEFGNGTGLNGHQHNQTDLIPFMNFNYVARVTRLNLAAFASFALAPETPEQPIVENIGGGDLRVTWPSVPSAPDLAGYRVALRGTADDSLMYFDIRDAGVDAGATQEFILTGVAPDVPVYVSVSAYDDDFNESIFSLETLATPVVAVPDGSLTSLPLELLSPNPTTGPTVVGLVLPAEGVVDLEVLDVGGRLVRRLLRGEPVAAGARRVQWDGLSEPGERPPSGLYFLRLAVDGRVVATIKVTRVL